MPPATVVVAQGDRIPVNPMMAATVQPSPPAMAIAAVPEAFAKDAVISWFRGEFAAANAVIDALCSHLTQLESGGASEYASVFAALHHRRVNWIPILHRQKYFSVADVTMELKKVALKKAAETRTGDKIEETSNYFAEPFNEKTTGTESNVEESEKPKPKPIVESSGIEEPREESGTGELPESEIADSGSQDHSFPGNVDIHPKHEDHEARLARIKMTKGFMVKEPVKGHMVNVVRGLKLYEDILTDVELSKLNDFVKELRVAGQNGELAEESFVLYNQQVKGNKRELIQLGIPIFGRIKEEATMEKSIKLKCSIEPIPALLLRVIEQLIQCHLIPEHRKPNSCIINFFDEGEYSQPFLKPPHLDQPISTLLLSESTMAFGRSLVSDSEGNYKGPLILSLKEGSLLVMRGNSSDTARHVVCASLNKRVSITFFRVRTETECHVPDITSLDKAMTLWKPDVPTPYTTPNGYKPMNMIPRCNLVRTPVVMLAPVIPTVVSPRRIPDGGGTGVFLPWTVRSRKPAKHLPPRAQRGRFLPLASSGDAHKDDKTSDSGITSS